MKKLIHFPLLTVILIVLGHTAWAETVTIDCPTRLDFQDKNADMSEVFGLSQQGTKVLKFTNPRKFSPRAINLANYNRSAAHPGTDSNEVLMCGYNDPIAGHNFSIFYDARKEYENCHSGHLSFLCDVKPQPVVPEKHLTH